MIGTSKAVADPAMIGTSKAVAAPPSPGKLCRSHTPGPLLRPQQRLAEWLSHRLCRVFQPAGAEEVTRSRCDEERTRRGAEAEKQHRLRRREEEARSS